MRKLLALIFSLFLICTCTMSVWATEAQYSTAGDLYEAWHNNLPDYICGVWSTDGGTANLTFGIQNNAAGNAGKQEILDHIENDLSVTFVYQEFSRNELLRMQREIEEYLEKNIRVFAIGLDERNNRISLTIFGKSNEYIQNLIKPVTEKYGKAVKVAYNNRICFTAGVADTPDTQLTLTQQPSMLMSMGMILLIIGIVFAITIRRKMLILQTNHGTTVSTTRLPSAKDVEDMVKQSNYSIPSDLKQKVMDMIERE